MSHDSVCMTKAFFVVVVAVVAIYLFLFVFHFAKRCGAAHMPYRFCVIYTAGRPVEFFPALTPAPAPRHTLSQISTAAATTLIIIHKKSCIT